MTPEQLQATRHKQIQKLIRLGFNDEIKKSEGTYSRLMPEFTPQPQSYIGLFDIPLLIDPRIPLKTHLKLEGIATSVNEEHITDNFQLPDTPYMIWTHDANRYRQFSISQALTKFQPGETPCPLIEVVSLYIHYPEIFKDHGVDAPGSSFGDGSIPCLDTFLGKPSLNHGSLDHPDSRWGTLSRAPLIQTSTSQSTEQHPYK